MIRWTMETASSMAMYPEMSSASVSMTSPLRTSATRSPGRCAATQRIKLANRVVSFKI